MALRVYHSCEETNTVDHLGIREATAIGHDQKDWRCDSVVLTSGNQTWQRKFPIHNIYIYIWVNYKDLTVLPNPGIMVNLWESIPFYGLTIQIGDFFYFPIYIYIYIRIIYIYVYIR